MHSLQAVVDAAELLPKDSRNPVFMNDNGVRRPALPPEDGFCVYQDPTDVTKPSCIAAQIVVLLEPDVLKDLTAQAPIDQLLSRFAPRRFEDSALEFMRIVQWQADNRYLTWGEAIDAAKEKMCIS